MAGLVLDEHGHDDVSWSRKEAGGILPRPTKLLLLVCSGGACAASRKDWHCVQNRAVVSWPRPGTEVRLDPAPPAPVRGFGGDSTERRRQPNGGSGEIDRHPIVAPVSGIA